MKNTTGRGYEQYNYTTKRVDKKLFPIDTQGALRSAKLRSGFRCVEAHNLMQTTVATQGKGTN